MMKKFKKIPSHKFHKDHDEALHEEECQDDHLNRESESLDDQPVLDDKAEEGKTEGGSIETLGDIGTDASFSTPKHLDDYLNTLNKKNTKEKALSDWAHKDQDFQTRIEKYAEVISKELYDIIDARVLAAKTPEDVKKEIIDFISTVSEQKEMNLIPNESEAIADVIEDDILGLGPLEDLLNDDDIADIMVDGPKDVYIERNGKIEKTNIHFRNVSHLMNVCQRIVTRVGRHVDMANPICDARLPDGSRVNVIVPPLSLNGPVLTIRKFKKERLTLDKMVELGTMDERTAALLQVIAACRVNTIISGGTGSGKTTLLNCMTKYISPDERIITCEDTAELQLQQPKVVRLETRPMNTEGAGEITMRDLVRNCLRMRPERIIVGEVRGPEAFDLLQAMNTGHDGSISTLHANSPRDALYRLENMVTTANLNIPIPVLREQIASSLEVLVHIQRLRDGSRKIMNISEIVDLTDNIITLQDIVHYEITGEDAEGNVIGEFVFSPLNPKFHLKARHYNLGESLMEIIEGGEYRSPQ